MNDITFNEKEDGYNIVRKYAESDYTVLANLYKNIDNSATSELIQKFHEDDQNIPVWSFIETLSFGRFIELYNYYYGIYGGASYSSFLGSIKFLRNAAAHNTCLLNSMRRPYGIKINKNKHIMDCLDKSKKFTTSFKTKMENPVIHDFVVLLFVYCDVLNTSANRSMREKGMEEVRKLFFETMLRKQEYFKKNDVLVENYKFICQVINYLENCRNKQILKNN